MAYPSKTSRKKILATAIEQVANDGSDNLAIRSVAAALGLAPSALYRHFANLAELKDALADESRRQLLGTLKKAAGNRHAEQAIRKIALAYVRFAREQPRLFAMTLMPTVTGVGQYGAHIDSWTFVLGHVARLYGEARAPEAAVALWAFLHGMTVLEAAGALGDRKPFSSIEFGLNIWIMAASDDATANAGHI